MVKSSGAMRGEAGNVASGRQERRPELLSRNDAGRSSPKPDSTPVRRRTGTPNRVSREPLGELSPNKTALRHPRREKPGPEHSKPIPASTPSEKDYSKLSTKYGQLKKQFKQMIDVAQRFRSDRDAWLQYAESLEAKLERLEARAARLGKPAAGSSFRPEPGVTASSSRLDTPLQPRPSPPSAQPIPAHVSPGHLPRSGGQEARSATGDADELPRLPEPPERVVIKDEPSSDEPVVVSERQVRKRKQPDDAGETPVARRIKSEHPSSDPAVVGVHHNFSPHSSLDLDHEQDPLTTPRKRRVLDHGSPSFDAENNSPEATRAEYQPHVDPVPDSRPAPITPAGPHEVQPPRTLRAFKPAHESRLTDGVADLAESEPASPENPGEPTDPTAVAGRLNTLLNRATPATDPPLLSRANRRACGVPPNDRFEIYVPTRELPFGKTGRRDNVRTPGAATTERIEGRRGGVVSAPRARASGINTTATTTPSHEARLRFRPVSALGLEDFKINPKFNGGQDYAFSEVVRNKAERAELPGCTDPQCCGKHFLAMARAELEAAGPSATRRPEGVALLEGYLGEQMYRLGGMTRPEKEQLWLEARTRELADKHGKHRDRFTRRQSPVGFWDADFPSTQEMARQREEGRRRERRLVEERRREALRGDGRWLFRDE